MPPTTTPKPSRRAAKRVLLLTSQPVLVQHESRPAPDGAVCVMAEVVS